jgi:DNA-binding SARP family transcriptional activator
MLSLQLLGGFELRDETGADLRAAVTQPKRLALLAFLGVVGPGRYQQREGLLSLLWPELEAEASRAALRQALHYLRTRLPHDLVRNRGYEEIGLDPAAVRTDVVEFEAAVARSDWILAGELYRGELLPGFYCPGTSAEFEQWLDANRRRLRRRAAEAARRRGVATAEAGRLDEVAQEVRKALELGSLDEGLIRQVMQLLNRSGDRASALRIYDEFTQRLRRELDLEPSERTRQLARDLRSSG